MAKKCGRYEILKIMQKNFETTFDSNSYNNKATTRMADKLAVNNLGFQNLKFKNRYVQTSFNLSKNDEMISIFCTSTILDEIH